MNDNRGSVHGAILRTENGTESIQDTFKNRFLCSCQCSRPFTGRGDSRVSLDFTVVINRFKARLIDKARNSVLR